MNGRLLITTVVRYADLQQDSGFVYVVDLATKALLMQAPMPESIHRGQDPNPRGGLRGARGATVFDGRLVLANTERLLFFDDQWRPVQQFTHPWLGGIHDILADEAGVWVCCTNADLLVQVSWAGEIINVWEWRQEAALREAFGLPHVPAVDRSLDYRDPETMRGGVRNTVHLNGVAPAGDGGLLLSFGRILSPERFRQAQVQGWLGTVAQRLGIGPRNADPRPVSKQPVGQVAGSSAAIVHLRQDGRATILSHTPDTKVPNHNVWQQGTRVLYNDSNSSELVMLAAQGRPEQRIAIPGDPPFARGLVSLDDECFLVGSQAPTAVHLVDITAGAVVDSMVLSDRPGESVYALCMLPDDFAAPPTQLLL